VETQVTPQLDRDQPEIISLVIHCMPAFFEMMMIDFVPQSAKQLRQITAAHKLFNDHKFSDCRYAPDRGA